jgi:hypothetical protein
MLLAYALFANAGDLGASAIMAGMGFTIAGVMM